MRFNWIIQKTQKKYDHSGVLCNKLHKTPCYIQFLDYLKNERGALSFGHCVSASPQYYGGVGASHSVAFLKKNMGARKQYKFM